MARVPDHPTSASLGLTTMTRTIHCPHCGVVLNVPEAAAGRKLKCPKCSTKFETPKAPGPDDSAFAGPSPASTLFPTRQGPASSGSVDLPRPKSATSPSPSPAPPLLADDLDLPTSSSPLRDMFDLPLLVDDAPKAKAQAPQPADALALFQDEPKSTRKPRGAEARAQARRCPTCSSVVPVGMSLCSTCGLDLDTGQRVAPLEIIDDDMPVVTRSPTPPLGVMLVGGTSALVNLALAVVSVVAWTKGAAGVQFLLIIWLFGVYASAQFLRRKSIRPLFLALSLAVGVGAVYLIVLPIYQATVVDDLPDPAGSGIVIDAPANPDDVPVVNAAERLNMNRIVVGIASLLAYAALAVYLNSPGVRREFLKK